MASEINIDGARLPPFSLWRLGDEGSRIERIEMFETEISAREFAQKSSMLDQRRGIYNRDRLIADHV